MSLIGRLSQDYRTQEKKEKCITKQITDEIDHSHKVGWFVV